MRATGDATQHGKPQRWGRVSLAYRAVGQHCERRLRQWLRLKHKVPGQGTSLYPEEFLYRKLGLIGLQQRKRSVS